MKFHIYSHIILYPSYKGLDINERINFKDTYLSINGFSFFNRLKKKCNSSCSQSDFYKGGFCDKNGCYY